MGQKFFFLFFFKVISIVTQSSGDGAVGDVSDRERLEKVSAA